MNLARTPAREWTIIAVAIGALGWSFADLPFASYLLLGVGCLGSLPTFAKAFSAAREKRISIETFNSFALAASLAALEWRAAVFIVLMLASAGILEQVTAARSGRAIEELLRLKPLTARRETESGVEEVDAGAIAVGDIILVENGGRIPVDGIVVYGEADVNEASVTGESRPIRKTVGDMVVSGTLNESGVLKIRARAVGADSTIERMAQLIREAAKGKSRVERLADRFAGIFLPMVALLGIGAYLVTRDINVVIALFLVACADDIAVAIPLAMTASLGQAARQGVIIKGGEWLDVLGRMTTIVLDKTGTLTYGERRLAGVCAAPDFHGDLWHLIGSAEKFSEQPIGRALFAAARENVGGVPADPSSFEAVRGYGVRASVGGVGVLLGNAAFMEREGVSLDAFVHECEHARRQEGSVVFAAVDGVVAAALHITDVPRPEAKASIAALRKEGVERVCMLTGDAPDVAASIASALGIEDVIAGVSPEDKLRHIEAFIASGGVVGVVGDGINDAPALSRADVGIAMGGAGMAVTVEAADVVILTDDLSRLPAMVSLGRRTRSVIYGDMAIWAATNVVGFALVFMGILGPVLAAVYNFATDFLPILNSARLFRSVSSK